MEDGTIGIMPITLLARLKLIQLENVGDELLFLCRGLSGRESTL